MPMALPCWRTWRGRGGRRGLRRWPPAVGGVPSVCTGPWRLGRKPLSGVAVLLFRYGRLRRLSCGVVVGACELGTRSRSQRSRDAHVSLPHVPEHPEPGAQEGPAGWDPAPCLGTLVSQAVTSPPGAAAPTHGCLCSSGSQVTEDTSGVLVSPGQICVDERGKISRGPFRAAAVLRPLVCPSRPLTRAHLRSPTLLGLLGLLRRRH